MTDIPTLAGLTTLLADDPVVAAATGGSGALGRGPGAGARAVRAPRSRARPRAGPSWSRSRPAWRRSGSRPTCASSSATTRSSSSPRGRRCRSSGCRPRPRRWAAGCASSGGCAPAATTCPRSIVAPVRALVQRLGPHVEDVEPVVVRPGCAARPRRARRAARHDRLPARVPGRGARRGRGARLDRRRVSRRPPITRCASTSGATRSTGCRTSRSPISGRRARSTSRGSSRCASCSPPTRCAPVPASCCRPNRGAASSGNGSRRATRSTAWSRGCRG